MNRHSKFEEKSTRECRNVASAVFNLHGEKQRLFWQKEDWEDYTPPGCCVFDIEDQSDSDMQGNDLVRDITKSWSEPKE